VKNILSNFWRALAWHINLPSAFGKIKIKFRNEKENFGKNSGLGRDRHGAIVFRFWAKIDCCKKRFGNLNETKRVG